MEHRHRIAAVLFLSAVVSLLGFSYAGGGIVAQLLSTSVTSERKVESLRAALDRWPRTAPLVYLTFVTAEVIVAPVPGTLLYLPGGLLFGGLLGGTLALGGNVLGAGICCQLMRSIAGRKATESFYTKRKLTWIASRIEKHGLVIIFLLRVNPLTSSDLVSYAAGLTGIRVRTVMLATLLGMAPLCYAQAYLAATLFDALPWLIWPTVFVCGAYLIAAFVAVWRLQTAGSRGDRR